MTTTTTTTTMRFFSFFSFPVYACSLAVCPFANGHPFEFTTIYNQPGRNIRKNKSKQSKTRAEVSNVMLSNGLMTSSKDLQQLSCYSDCCSKGKRAKLALSLRFEQTRSRLFVRQIALFGHSFSFATNLERCFHGHWFVVSLIFTIRT